MYSVNFKKLCRVCLRESEFVTPIFGSVFKSDIPDKLAYCTGLEIKSRDGKPNLICQSCIDNLHISYAFKKTCLENDRRFFRHFFGIIKDVRVNVERINVDVKPRKVEFEIPLIKNEVDNDEIVIIKLDDSDNDNDGQDYVDNDFHYDDQNGNVEHKSKCDINIDKSLLEPLKDARKVDDDDDDDFYWHNDEHLMSVLESERDTKNKKQRRKETKPRKKYKQRLNKDGTPKISKRQLQRERPKVRKICPDGEDFVKTKKLWPKVFQNRCCEVCDLRFPSQEEREKHANAVHGGVTPNVICEVCGKMFSRQYIDGHRLAHYPPQYSCKEPGCTFKTTRSNHMSKHMAHIHTSRAGADRPTYTCNQCGRVFNWRCSLTTHKRLVHNDQREFPCSYCGKAFKEKGKKDRHELIHTNNKQYECEYCSSGFLRRDIWRTHMINQHGVVPPPTKGGPRMHRVVEIDKLKDAGKLVALEKTNDTVDKTNENLDKTNENLDISNEKSDFTIGNIIHEQEVEIAIEDTDLIMITL